MAGWGGAGRLELWFQTEYSSALMSETHLGYFYVMMEALPGSFEPNSRRFVELVVINK